MPALALNCSSWEQTRLLSQKKKGWEQDESPPGLPQRGQDKTTYVRRTRSSRAPRPLGPPHLCPWSSHVHLRCFRGPIGSSQRQQATRARERRPRHVRCPHGRTPTPQRPRQDKPPVAASPSPSRPPPSHHARLYAHPSPPHGEKEKTIVSFHPEFPIARKEASF